MRTEVLEIKRCCFFLPLRYSLILWGYFLLICSTMNVYSKIVAIKDIIILQKATTKTEIGLDSFVLFMESLDLVLVIIFIIGAHKKNVKLLKIFYIYGLGILTLQTLITVLLFILMSYEIYILYKRSELKFYPSSKTWVSLMTASYFIAYIIIKCYLLLLVRSEIIKLKNSCQFRFVNNATESECTMKYKKTDDELGIEGICDEETCDNKDTGLENFGTLRNESEYSLKNKNEEELGSEECTFKEHCESKESTIY